MNVFLIMLTEKYNSFSSEDRALVEQNNLLHIHDIRIKNPDNPEDMILLSYVFDDSQISQWTSKISGLEGKVEGIQEILNEMGEELKQYLTSSDLDDYVNRKELQEILDGFVPDISDSDLDIIAEKVTEKVKLTWKVI